MGQLRLDLASWLLVYPAMSRMNPCTVASVPCNLNVNKLKKRSTSLTEQYIDDISKMKQNQVDNARLLQETSILVNELSTSLPDLTTLESSAQKNREEQNMRNSLTNVSDTKMSFQSGEDDKSSMSQRTEKQCDVELSSQFSSTVTSKNTSDTHNLRIAVNNNNNRLSAVLENISLVYLPQTKQLVSLQPNDQNMQLNAKPEIKPAEKIEILPQEKKEHEHDTTDVCSNSHVNNTNSIHTKTRERADCTKVQDTVLYTCALESLSSHSSQNESESSIKSQGSVMNCHDQESMKHFQASQSLHAAAREVVTDDTDSIDDLLSYQAADKDGSPKADLHQTNKSESLTRADASSFSSSISSLSTGTEFSISAASYSDDYIETRPLAENEDTGFVEINLNSRNTFERSNIGSQDSGIDEKQYHGAKPKRRTGGILTSFLSKNIFSRKAKEPPSDQSESAPGWKLFGKVPPKQTAQRDASAISQDYQAKLRTRKTDVEVSSTTALILEQRPQGLPCKDPEEEERHKMEYDAMVEGAKRKEAREAKQRRKAKAAQLRQEEALAAAVQTWNNQILQHWSTMHSSKRARELWWQGLPPSVRGKVWKLAIGNDLNVTQELYEICLNRAKEKLKLLGEMGDSDQPEEPAGSKEASVDLIRLDVSRTFPQLCIFQKGGPYNELLQGLLGAYVCYRPDVGYVQGMSFIAAVLLLNMEASMAFQCFANLLNRPCQIAFFRLDEALMKSYFSTYDEFFLENQPRLHSHFQKQNLTPDLYLIDWIFTLYSKSLPLDVACRVWDVFCRDGEEFLFRTALGILSLYDEVLLNMDFIYLAQFLTKLPEKISCDQLFNSIDNIYMNIDKQRFAQVLSSHTSEVTANKVSS